MTKSLIQLPEIIFTLIQTFLSYDDYHYFLNTSKLHFSHLKRRTIVFRLTERRSLQYMEDKEFQGLLLSKVEDGWKQIRISLKVLKSKGSYHASDPNVPHDSSYFDVYLENLSYDERKMMTALPPFSLKVKELCLSHFTVLKDVSTLSHLSKLEISYSAQLEDISPLKNIPNLTFNSCQALSDLSMLCGEKSKVINFILCTRITGIHSLSNFRSVTLSCCPSLEDVSPLHGVYDVSISLCRCVKDISGLGGHHRLEISCCSYNLIGYSSLAGVSKVKLVECDISDLRVLRYAKSVELRNCSRIQDVSPIKNVRRVTVTLNPLIWNIHELNHVYDLSIQEIPEIYLRNLSNYKLEIDFTKIDLRKMSSLYFPNTQHLTLLRLPSPLISTLKGDDVAYFRHLQSITLHSTNDLYAIIGFEEIPTVRLINMWALIDISGLGRNRYVELNNCPQIKDVSSLANVSVVRIEECDGIVDYCVLSKVPRLKIVEKLSHN